MLPTFFCRLLSAGYLKCTHMHAHTKSLPSWQAIFKKMYTFAGIFFRWFYVYTCIRSFPPLPILPAFFRSRHTHKNTPLPPSAIYFLNLFFFVNPNGRQKKYKNKRIYRNKKNVFVNRGFPRSSIKNKRKIKKSKG